MKARITPRGRLALRVLQSGKITCFESLMESVLALEERHGSAEKALQVLGEPSKSATGKTN